MDEPRRALQTEGLRPIQEVQHTAYRLAAALGQLPPLRLSNSIPNLSS